MRRSITATLLRVPSSIIIYILHIYLIEKLFEFDDISSIVCETYTCVRAYNNEVNFYIAAREME